MLLVFWKQDSGRLLHGLFGGALNPLHFLLREGFLHFSLLSTQWIPLATKYQMGASFLAVGSYAARLLEAGFRETAPWAFWWDFEPTALCFEGRFEIPHFYQLDGSLWQQTIRWALHCSHLSRWPVVFGSRVEGDCLGGHYGVALEALPFVLRESLANF